MKNLLLIIACLFTLTWLYAKEAPVQVERVDPPNWWVGMQDTSLQLCIHGKSLANANVLIDYDGITVKKVFHPENSNYLFVDLAISRQTKPGNFNLVIGQKNNSKTYIYHLSPKDTVTKRGYSDKDLVYLIMPDRFANGDTTNDVVKGTQEAIITRDSIFGRHGGDIKGVIDHLDYLKDLGVTTLWLTPVQQNDQPKESYHGYAFTDHYKIDPRLGSLAVYNQLVKQAHEKNLKVIMDMVFNHVGSQHWFIKDLPMHDWIHQHDTFVQTNYRATALMDPYASAYDKDKMSNGWFVKSMPDLNQQNPYVAKYLIQNALWWIAATGIDGFRIDTYSYSDLDFMARLMAAIKSEYPTFNAIGEVWEHGVAVEAYWTQHSKIRGVPETNLPGVTDFQLYDAINEALTKPMGWTEGLSRVYYTLAKDFLYDNPNSNLVFLDNHDLSRFYSVVGEDINKYKMGIGFLMTTRGIPCLYYGTEVLMKNYADPDGKVRADFPGGWAADKQNKFTEQGRSAQENEVFNFVRTLAQYRQQNAVLQTGKLTQFVPENDVYVYFRSNAEKTIMVVMHYADKDTLLDTDRFKEMLTGYSNAKNIVTGKTVPLNVPLALSPYSINILELEK